MIITKIRKEMTSECWQTLRQLDMFIGILESPIQINSMKGDNAASKVTSIIVVHIVGKNIPKVRTIPSTQEITEEKEQSLCIVRKT